MKKRVCFTTEVSGMPITLVQHGKNRFTVIYWQQKKSGLTYAEAAKELGECIMHASACVGTLSNEEL